MKNTLLAIVLLFATFNLLNAQTSGNTDYSTISLNEENLREGNEKLNIFLYKTLGEMKTSLKKQKTKLKEIGENDGYYSMVEKEKKTLKILNEIKKIESAIDQIRKKISNERYTKAFQFQKTPEGVINHFFNAFKIIDFSKFDYLIDPYGEYTGNMNYFSLMSVFTTYLKSDNPFSKFENDLTTEVINTRIKNDRAFVLVKIKNNEVENNNYRYRDSSNEERLFTLINRKGNWYLLDIDK